MQRRLIAIAFLQAIGLSLLAYLLPTWQDEEFTLATTLHGVPYAIGRALFYEHQGPLYFAIVAFFREVTPSVFFARELSVACIVGLTFLAAALAREIWPRASTTLFALLVALNPFVVFAALEIRLYALSLVLQATLFLSFFRGFYNGTDRLARIGFALCATAGIYTQYFAALDVVACWAALAVTGRTLALRDCILFSLIPFLGFAPMVPIVRGQAAGAMSNQLTGPTTFGGRFLHPVDFIFASRFGPLGHVADIVTNVAKFGVALGVILGRPRMDRRFASLLALALVTHLAYASIEFATHRFLVAPRHFVALAFPEAIALYALVRCCSPTRALAATAAIAIALLASDIAVLAATYAPLAKNGDAKRVGAFLRTHAAARDVIAVYPGDAMPAIARYYRGGARVVGYPTSLDARSYTVDQSDVRSTAQARAAFDKLPAARELWFVELGVCDAANINGCRDVAQVAHERYRALSERAFYATTVFEYRPRTKRP